MRLIGTKYRSRIALQRVDELEKYMIELDDKKLMLPLYTKTGRTIGWVWKKAP